MAGVRTSGNVDGTCLGVGMVAGERFYHGDGRTRAETGVGEDLAEVGRYVEVD